MAMVAWETCTDADLHEIQSLSPLALVLVCHLALLIQCEMFTRIQVRPRTEVQAVRMENWVCRRAAQGDCNTRS